MAFKPKTKSKSRRKRRKTLGLVECRSFRTTGGGFLAGLMTSHAEHESPIERALLIHLILCSDIELIESQKTTVGYIGVGGGEASYTPDFTVTVAGLPIVLEAKALTFLCDDEAITKYSTIARQYLLAGISYHFVVDAQLEEMPRASNVRLLFRYATSPAPDGMKVIAVERLTDGPKPIRQICSDGLLQLVDVYTLIANKHLCIDWNQPLGIDSLVSLPEQPFGGLKLEHILRSTRFSGLLEELAMGRRPSDQRLLALAKVWRQRVYALSPFNFVGGLPDGLTLLDSAEGESGAGRDGWGGDLPTGGPNSVSDFSSQRRM